jgi:hypothetical protein
MPASSRRTHTPLGLRTACTYTALRQALRAGAREAAVIRGPVTIFARGQRNPHALWHGLMAGRVGEM